MEEEIKLEVAKNVDTKDIELALQTDKKVDEAVVEKSLNYDALTPEEKSAIDEFFSKVDVKNTAQILQFGSSAQSNISKFSDSVLNDVRTKSSGEVGDLLSGLVTEIKEFNQYRKDGRVNPFFDDDNKPKQLSLLMSLLDCLPIYQVYVENTECDDIIDIS